jgi:lysophospholipase L1-like esterase
MNDKTQKILAYTILGLTFLGLTSFVLIKTRKSKGVKIKNKNPKKILIVGDSQSIIKSDSGGAIKYTYPNILIKDFPDKKFDVMASVGKTTKWMLDNLPAKLSSNKYDRVYIYGGGNDMTSGVSVDTALANIQKMADLSKENGADVFVNLGYKIEGVNGKFGNYNIMPTTPYIKTKQQWIPLVEKRRQLQKSLSKSINGVNFIPVYDLKQNTTDGIHPTAEGHKLVASEFKKTLK